MHTNTLEIINTQAIKKTASISKTYSGKAVCDKCNTENLRKFDSGLGALNLCFSPNCNNAFESLGGNRYPIDLKTLGRTANEFLLFWHGEKWEQA